MALTNLWQNVLIPTSVVFTKDERVLKVHTGDSAKSAAELTLKSSTMPEGAYVRHGHIDLEASLYDFPAVRKALLMIGYDMGSIDRQQSEQEFFEKANQIFAEQLDSTFSLMDISVLNIFLQYLPSADFELLCTGDQAEFKHAIPPSQNNPGLNVDHILTILLEL